MSDLIPTPTWAHVRDGILEIMEPTSNADGIYEVIVSSIQDQNDLRRYVGLALNAVSDYDGLGRDPVLAESLLKRAWSLIEAHEQARD